MPCFKGLAVSIHTPEGPLPEYSIQKQSRVSRISSYIPVPPPKIPTGATRHEQSTFAISITLLTPGLPIPYSTPKPTPDNTHPRPKIVGESQGLNADRTSLRNVINPYTPLTSSPNETIAAYIYFDGRPKEEVATLLRLGEETWVNSRWVSVPDSEGGGLAEREFLFREVGLERWLNGLDLEGKDAAKKIEKRRQRMEKKRRKRKDLKGSDDEDGMGLWGSSSRQDKGVLRYGADKTSPLEQMSDDNDGSSSDTDSDDDPVPEAAGQIKVALFRVLASGEIKKGEYSPQFDAHDDDEDYHLSAANGTDANTNGGSTEEVDHTTSFAKPKSLDKESISTQTVTGIDGPDHPFAVFTFLYRGEKQLQKMGILPSPVTASKPANAAKRKSGPDFGDLKPLKPTGGAGFSAFRDTPRKAAKRKDKAPAKTDSDMDDSDEDLADDEGPHLPTKVEDADGHDMGGKMLSPEDAKRQGELAEGVQKIKLKRQHSAEPVATPSLLRKTSTTATPGDSNSPVSNPADSAPSLLPNSVFSDQPSKFDDSVIGSPLKRARASLPGGDDSNVGSASHAGLGLGLSGMAGDIMGRIEQDQQLRQQQQQQQHQNSIKQEEQQTKVKMEEPAEDEEL